MTRSIGAILILVCLSALPGCGLRGPLFLPKEKAETQTEAAQPAAPAAESESVNPQPAPQAQKRDRPANAADPQATPVN